MRSKNQGFISFPERIWVSMSKMTFDFKLSNTAIFCSTISLDAFTQSTICFCCLASGTGMQSSLRKLAGTRCWVTEPVKYLTAALRTSASLRKSQTHSAEHRLRLEIDHVFISHNALGQTKQHRGSLLHLHRLFRLLAGFYVDGSLLHDVACPDVVVAHAEDVQ